MLDKIAQILVLILVVVIFIFERRRTERLRLEDMNPNYKPPAEDEEAFRKEIQEKLRRKQNKKENNDVKKEC